MVERWVEQKAASTDTPSVDKTVASTVAHLAARSADCSAASKAVLKVGQTVER